MPTRRPETTTAYLVGGGIASLVAAVHLYYDAGVPAHQIHIIEAAAVSGGSMSSGGLPAGDDAWQRGYVVLAARKLNFSYSCLYDTLARVPSTRNPGYTVLDDVRGVADDVPAADGRGGQPGETGRGGQARQTEQAPQTTQSTGRTGFPARLVAQGLHGPDIVDVKSMGLKPEERMGLLGLILEPEECVGDGQIQAHFKPDFFESKFWDVWASLYAFQPWHSAVEFRRYLLRFLHEFSHISTLEGIDHAPLNDYECIILPLEHHLRSLGVNFQYNTQVLDVGFATGDTICASQLRMRHRGDDADRLIQVGPDDIVLITLGSLTAGVGFGSNDTPPPPLPSQEAIMADPGPVWRFWAELANPCHNAHYAAFGRPQRFYSHISKSSWLGFTVTLSGTATALFRYLKAWAGYEDHDHGHDHSHDNGQGQGQGRGQSQSQSHNHDHDRVAQVDLPHSHSSPRCHSSFSNSNGPLITFRDSPWMMSITMPRQPYFTGQPADVCVLWGYGLYPDQEGLFVRKPMMACTGAEIFSELLSYLGLPGEGVPGLGSSSSISSLSSLSSMGSGISGGIASGGGNNDSGNGGGNDSGNDGGNVIDIASGAVTTIPCLMPFIGSPYLTRSDGDRPRVLPDPGGNLGLVGQFVEMDRDVTFTMEYSARSAQTAVFGLMGLDKPVPAVHRGDRDVQVLGEMLMTIMS